MKHIFLITTLFLCTTYSSHTMDAYAIKPFGRKECYPLPIQTCLEGITNDNPELLQKGLSSLLSTKEGDINYNIHNGRSLLYLACSPKVKSFNKVKSINNESCIKLLLSQDTTAINLQDYYGITPLHIACNNKNFKAIEQLINKGADPTVQDINQHTPLYRLFLSLDAIAIVDFFSDNNSYISRRLIHATDKDNNTQLHLCSTIPISNYELSQIFFRRYLCFLFSQNIDPAIKNINGKMAIDLTRETRENLYNQYQAKHFPYLANALKHQTNNTEIFVTTLSKEFPERIDITIEPIEQKVDGYNTIPLIFTAIKNQNLGYIQRRLNIYSKDINTQDNDGNTALHLTSLFITKSIDTIDTIHQAIKMLIDKGALTTIKNNLQETPIINLFNNFIYSLRRLPYLLKQYPDMTDKLILATDEQKNSQFHLCTELQSTCWDKRFEEYLFFLQRQGLDIHAKNNDGKRALDLACEAYNRLRKEYYRTKKISYIKEALDNQEYIMHTFLRLTSPRIQKSLFKLILEQTSADGIQLPDEVMSYITYFFYAIHIETVIAKRYNNNTTYYHDFIENKDTIRQQLLDNPNLELLWSA